MFDNADSRILLNICSIISSDIECKKKRVSYIEKIRQSDGVFYKIKLNPTSCNRTMWYIYSSTQNPPPSNNLNITQYTPTKSPPKTHPNFIAITQNQPIYSIQYHPNTTTKNISRLFIFQLRCHYFFNPKEQLFLCSHPTKFTIPLIYTSLKSQKLLHTLHDKTSQNTPKIP